MKKEQERAYQEYVTARLPALRRVAYLLCQDWHRADDLVQSAAMRLYLHWGRASRADNIDAYAHTVLVRVFLQEQRGSWYRRVNMSAPLPETVAPPVDDAARMQVRAALATLPPRQRATLVLRYYCDLSVDQVAASLQCSAGTVKSQTARGLESLRRAMGPHEGLARNERMAVNG